MLTTEQLLQPRYKVIANYFFSPYNIEDLVIVDLQQPYPSFYSTITYDDIANPNKTWTHLSEIDNYPHIFRKLRWWEDRELSDLPLYIRFGDKDKQHKIYKVDSWGLEAGFKDYEPCAYAEGYDEYLISLRFPNNFPSTEEEYLNQPAISPNQ